MGKASQLRISFGKELSIVEYVLTLRRSADRPDL